MERRIFLALQVPQDFVCHLRTLSPEAGISDMDKKLHPTEYCGMQKDEKSLNPGYTGLAFDWCPRNAHIKSLV